MTDSFDSNKNSSYFNSEIKQLLITNLILFLVGIYIVPEYRVFFLLVTTYLFSILTSWCIDYFISLSIAISEKHEEENNGPVNKDQHRRIAKFLFRNETFYKIFKHLNSQSIRKEIQKVLTLSSHEYEDLSLKEVRSRTLTDNSELNEVNIAVEINSFTKKLSINFIDNWYLSSISTNEQFPQESQLELEYLLNGIFKLNIYKALSVDI